MVLQTTLPEISSTPLPSMTPAAAKTTKRSPWRLSLLVLVLLTGGYWGYRHFRGPATPDLEVGANTVPVERQDLRLRISASGTIQPDRVVNISPKQAGVVEEILVEEGERVESGQLLAIMDSSDLMGRLLQAQGELTAAQANLQRLLSGSRPQEITQVQARLENARAALRQAEDQLERTQELWQEGGISDQQLTLVEADRDRALANVNDAEQALALVQEGPRPEEIAQARAQVQAAQGAVQTIQSSIDDTQIRAPFAGIVTRRFAEQGAFVTPSTVQVGSSDSSPSVSSAILSIAGTNQAVVNVAESDIRRIQIGQAAQVRADAFPDRAFAGQVARIAPQAVVQQNVISFEVELSVQDPQQLLRPGMSVDVDFEVGQLQNVLVVPTVSILRQGEDIGVYVVGPEGEPTFVPLDVGETVGRVTQIRAGLSDEERVYITFPEGFQPSTDSLIPL